MDKTIRELRDEIYALGKSRDMVVDRSIRKVSEINKKIFNLENKVAKMRIEGAVKPPTA